MGVRGVKAVFCLLPPRSDGHFVLVCSLIVKKVEQLSCCDCHSVRFTCFIVLRFTLNYKYIDVEIVASSY